MLKALLCLPAAAVFPIFTKACVNSKGYHCHHSKKGMATLEGTLGSMLVG